MNYLKYFPFSFIVSFIIWVDFYPSIKLGYNQESKNNSILRDSNVIFQSLDNGNTWLNIGNGLPDNKENYDLFAYNKGLFIHADNEMFELKPNTSSPNWTKAYAIKDLGDIKVCKTGLYAVNYKGIISKKRIANNVWAPVYSNFREKNLRSIFETSNGAVLIGTDNGLFKSTNDGKTWKEVVEKGWIIKIIESNGVLIATSQNGIIRSTDDGESWKTMINEGGVGIDVAIINGGFAAITYNTSSKTRRVRISNDNGKTWQAVDGGLPPDDSIVNILQVDNYLFCGHPKGIFRSSDKGKNWSLIKPAIGDKVFNIYSIGKAIYAIPKAGGC